MTVSALFYLIKEGIQFKNCVFFILREYLYILRPKAALYFVNISDKIRSSINKLTLQINYQDIYVAAQYLNISQNPR